MRPFAVMTAIILGSAAAIAFGLVGSLIVFLVLRGQYPQFDAELPVLARFSGLFLALAAVAGGALYSWQKNLSWRWVAQGLMWAAVLLTGWCSWPRPY